MIFGWARSVLYEQNRPNTALLHFSNCSVNSIIGIGDAYIMAIAMLYGPAPCFLATFFHTLSASLFVPNRPKVYVHRVLLNTSSMVCGAWLYSNLYKLLNPSQKITRPITWSSSSPVQQILWASPCLHNCGALAFAPVTISDYTPDWNGLPSASVLPK